MKDLNGELVSFIAFCLLAFALILAVTWWGADARRTQVELARITHECPLKGEVK